MNNKIIPLMTSGSNQTEIDIVNNTAKAIEFVNLGDIYVYKLNEDTSIITKNGNVLEGKSGDIVVKSHCRSLYYIDTKGSFEELLNMKISNDKSEREEELKELTTRPLSEENCINIGN